MFAIYKLIFWIPAVASAVMLWASWSTGFISRPLPLVLWFGLALLLQVTAGLFSPLWVIGLALQVILAVSLSLKWKLG